MFLAFDTETTGLLDSCNVLTAYFIILDDKLNEIANLDLKIKYNHYNVNIKALEINKIDLIKHDKEAISQKDARNKLDYFLSVYKTKDNYIPLGHNISFDLKMLKNNDILTDSAIETYLSPVSIDTLTIAKFMKTNKKIPKKQSLSLSKISEYFNINLGNDSLYHTAEYDIKMTIELFKILQTL